jgi:hypothetical protein
MKKFSSTLLVLIVSVLFAKILCEEGKNFHITSYNFETGFAGCRMLGWACFTF